MPRYQSDADLIKEQEFRDPDAGKVAQGDAKAMYLPPSEGPFHCGGCVNFLSPHSCQKVTGFIEAGGCCNLYEKGNNPIKAEEEDEDY